jgi:predicted oxidoreductase (fatty acid repression mutant protein)
LIDAQVAARHAVPSDWQLKGQLVFGLATGTLKEKTFKPLEDRVLVRSDTEEMNQIK